MPLKSGTSRETFSTNVKEMMDAGHPQKVSLAAAYSEKRKSERRRKMWRGGEVDLAPESPGTEMSESDLENEAEEHGQNMGQCPHCGGKI